MFARISAHVARMPCAVRTMRAHARFPCAHKARMPAQIGLEETGYVEFLAILAFGPSEGGEKDKEMKIKL